MRGEAESALQKDGLFPFSASIVGKVVRMERGLNHENYLFWIQADSPLPYPEDTAYILRKIATDTPETSHEEAVARLRNEAMTLQALAMQDIVFSVPRFVCFIGDPEETPSGFIETALPGGSIEHFKKNADSRPLLIETVARIAATIHHLPIESFRFLPTHAASRDHVLASLDAFSPDFLAQDPDAPAVDWVRDHLPEDRPATLLHGDLLPQNILWDLETDGHGVVDWEYAMIGDPAYDLAIVTRGHGKPLGCPDGLQRLVDGYCRAGGIPITPIDVINHELLMVLGWLEQSIETERKRRHEGHPPKHWRDQIRAILRRAERLRKV